MLPLPLIRSPQKSAKEGDKAFISVAICGHMLSLIPPPVVPSSWVSPTTTKRKLPVGGIRLLAQLTGLTGFSPEASSMPAKKARIEKRIREMRVIIFNGDLLIMPY
jgi:hypothetical protein